MKIRTYLNICFLMMAIGVAGCARSLSESELQEPQVNFDPSAMDAPLQCLGQHLWDEPKPPLTRILLLGQKVRVALIPDKSGKTTPTAPSDNPAILQSYAQDGLSRFGAFDHMAMERQDLPLRGGVPHVPTTYPARWLIGGVLDGDSELRSDELDAQVSIGPVNLFFTGRHRLITQRLTLEFVNNLDGTIVSNVVRDPYTGKFRRMHMIVTVEVRIPETAATGAVSGATAAGDGGTVSGSIRANADRPRALRLAVNAALFEMMRRLTDNYAAGDRCLTPEARRMIRFSTRLPGIVVDPAEVEALVKRMQVMREQARRGQVQAPQPREPQAAPRPAPEPQIAPAARPGVPRSLPVTGVARNRNGRAWTVSSQRIQPEGASADDVKAFVQRVPPDLLARVGKAGVIALFNAVNQSVEEGIRANAAVTVSFGSRLGLQIIAAAAERKTLPWGRTYCRHIRIGVKPDYRSEALLACRYTDRSVWAIGSKSTPRTSWRNDNDTDTTDRS